jgi:hypothetical protein
MLEPLSSRRNKEEDVPTSQEERSIINNEYSMVRLHTMTSFSRNISREPDLGVELEQRKFALASDAIYLTCISNE